MNDQSGQWDFTTSVLVVALALLCCAPAQCRAKPKKAVQTSSDPCAAPIAFVQDHINKIKALQKIATASEIKRVQRVMGRSEIQSNANS